MTEGLCRRYREVNFFPSQGEDLEPARRVCRRCPVQVPCLEYALAFDVSLDGVWAGTSKADSARLRSERGKLAPDTTATLVASVAGAGSHHHVTPSA